MSALLYLDASAVVKLIRNEPESRALLSVLGAWPERVTSSLTALEVRRALRRVNPTTADWRRAAEVLRRIGQIGIGEPILESAAELDPPALRTLDAIHLATAISLGQALGALATYDRRLHTAAVALEIEVLSPT